MKPYVLRTILRPARRYFYHQVRRETPCPLCDIQERGLWLLHSNTVATKANTRCSFKREAELQAGQTIFSPQLSTFPYASAANLTSLSCRLSIFSESERVFFCSRRFGSNTETINIFTSSVFFIATNTAIKLKGMYPLNASCDVPSE